MQQLIDQFLYSYRDKRIAVYGTGLNAERVICGVEGYCFSCVISSETNLFGKDFFGKEVLSLQEALTRCDIILIAAIPSATRIVYERIKESVPMDKQIFDLSGNQLNAPKQYERHDYWNVCYEDIIHAIDVHEVISFDVFDTLLMRRCLYPNTVFKIMEAAPPISSDALVFQFSRKRREAENKLYADGKHPTVYEIYKRLAVDYGFSENDFIQMVERELELERRLIKRREDMYRAYRHALEKGKKIFLTSDMYLTKEIIDSMLSAQGIFGYQDLLVSCEHGCNKVAGELFGILKQKADSMSILHIGDNLVSDIESAKNAGFDTFHIWSSMDLLLNSSAAYVISRIGSVWDEVLLGEILSSSGIFNSPFKLGGNKGKIRIDSVEDMTRICFIPVTLGFISWLVTELRGKKEAAVLFVSRDGYLLERLYRDIRNKYPELELPKSIYFYSSRRVMSDVIPISKEGIETLTFHLDQYRKTTILRHLEKLFGLEFAGDMKKYECKRYEEINRADLMCDLLSEKNRIFEHAKKCRKQYLKYIETLCLEKYSDIYVVDLVAQGSVRYGLSSLLEKEVTMLSLGTTNIPNAFVKDPALAKSMYGQLVTGVGGAISRMFNLLELIYGSRDGQVRGFTDSGEPLFDETAKYNVKLLDKVQGEILSFVTKYPDKEWFLHGLSCGFAESMLGILDPAHSDIAMDVRKLFDFFDPMDESTERFNVLNVIRGETS